jgi:hypothetical protein
MDASKTCVRKSGVIQVPQAEGTRATPYYGWVTGSEIVKVSLHPFSGAKSPSHQQTPQNLGNQASQLFPVYSRGRPPVASLGPCDLV